MAVGSHSSVSEHLQLKQETLGLISDAATPGYFSHPAGFNTNVDGMKDLWCSSIVRLLSAPVFSPGFCNKDIHFGMH